MAVRPELHRPMPIERIGSGGHEQHIEAAPAELAALAERLGVPALASLVCHFRLARGAGRSIVAQGRLEARMTRVCVISLDEFETGVREEFSVRFVAAGEESDALDLEAEDEIPYGGEKIDLGEAAVQQLALALDPYPRKPDAELPEEPGDAQASPFDVLRERRRMH